MPVARAVVVAVGFALVAGGCSQQSRVAGCGRGRQWHGPRSRRRALGRRTRQPGGVSAGEGAFAVLTLGLACATGACTGIVYDTTTGNGARTIPPGGLETPR